MAKNKQVLSFFNSATHRALNAKYALDFEKKTIFTPYPASIYHVNSLAYPIINTVSCVYSALRIAYGIALILPAIFYTPHEALPNVFRGIGLEMGDRF